MKAKAIAVARSVAKHRVFFLFVMGLFTVGLLAGSYAIQSGATFPGQTAAGDHNWWADQGTGAFCERCHVDVIADIAAGPHKNTGYSDCTFCHAPGGTDHAAAVATCADCHDGGTGGSQAGELVNDAHAGIYTDLGEDQTTASQTCQSCHTHVAVNVTATVQPPLELNMG